MNPDAQNYIDNRIELSANQMIMALNSSVVQRTIIAECSPLFNLMYYRFADGSRLIFDADSGKARAE